MKEKKYEYRFDVENADCSKYHDVTIKDTCYMGAAFKLDKLYPSEKWRKYCRGSNDPCFKYQCSWGLEKVRKRQMIVNLPEIVRNFGISEVPSTMRIVARSVGRAFHPDTNFEDYIRTSDGQPMCDRHTAGILNEWLHLCFVVCEHEEKDIYEIANEVMDELFPNAE